MPIRSDTYLRRAERDDLETIVAWMEEPDFQRFLYGDPARSPKAIREHIVGLLGRGATHTMPGGIYLLIDSPSKGPVGILSLQNISWRNRSCTLDLYIGQARLRGTLTAALAMYRAFCYCFDELNLNRVGAYIYAFNTPSWRLLEKSGAKREVVLHDHVLRDGEHHDLYGYGLLRSEFEALKADVERTEGTSLAEMIAQATAAERPA